MSLIGAKTSVRRARLKELSAQGPPSVYKRNVQTVEAAKKPAFELCPKDSGDLASTIRVVKNPQTLRAALVAGGTAKSGRDVRYAKYVEAEQPFIKPAIALSLRRSRSRPLRMHRG